MEDGDEEEEEEEEEEEKEGWGRRVGSLNEMVAAIIWW